MLVLSRKMSETVVLPDLDVVFKIIEVRGNTVRVGIDAPREIKVLRGEKVAQDAAEAAAQEGNADAVGSDNPDAD